MANKKISDIFPIGQKVFFRSGNFIGRYAVVESVINETTDARAIYGFLIDVKFEDGSIGVCEKTEHIEKVK